MLEQYRHKRHFDKTAEPPGDVSGRPKDEEAAPAAGGSTRPNGPLYVIQKHAASRLHYDFRLELDGVLLSWAIPKGPSLNPRDRHLAARVEDHPLEYGGFEGTIPKGEYGGGTVELWDRGTWEPEGDPHGGLAKGDFKFTLHGEKLKGSWVLVRTKPRPGQEKKENWLLIKHRDEEAVDGDGQAILADLPRSVASGRTLEEIHAEAEASIWHGDRPATEQTDARAGEDFKLDPSSVSGARATATKPGFVRPELATLVEKAPEGDRWLHEVKFDGYRALSTVEAGHARMFSRNEKDWSAAYPGLVDELAKLPVESAVLDGEVVVQMPDGTTSFQEVQHGGRAAGQLLYYIFDVLYLNGHDLTGAAIEDRKELLKRLLLRAPGDGSLRYSEHILGQGGAFLEEACRLGLEGIVSKKAATPYRPGVRGGEWLKSKCKQDQEFVIGGFTDPAGSRVGFGALLLGVNESGRLRFVGKVGTGFDHKLLRDLGKRLRELEVDEPPFIENLKRAPRAPHWVKPELVAQVEFSEWTRGGGIRHPSFRGLREDKSAHEVVPQIPVDPAKVQAAAATGGGAADRAGSHEVTITHPDRILWTSGAITKRDLISYYQSVAARMMPYVVGRPVSMVRCPDGVTGEGGVLRQGRGLGGPCFFHKHPGADFPGSFQHLTITESGGPAAYLAISEPASLTGLAQMGVLEIHVWGSTAPDIEHPDMIVFDLDPDPTVEWKALADGARLVRAVLQALGLESFVKTTGGKGLHVVVPVTPTEDWEAVRRFCKAVADAVVARAPDLYTANMSKAKRTGKIYVDYVRNNRGATSIAPYSTRANEHAAVSVPIRWSELGGSIRPGSYTLRTLQNRLRRLRSDPWQGFFDVQRAQSISARAKEALGLSS